MSLNVLTQGGGTGGASASIFVTGLSESDVVTATKDGKTLRGKWETRTAYELVSLIPQMTSNTTPSGTASSTSSHSSQLYRAYYAFDGNENTTGDAWYGYNPALGQRIIYTFDAVQTDIRKVYISGYGNNGGTVNSGVVEYTEDGTEWKTLATFTPNTASVTLELDVSVDRLIAIRAGATSTSNGQGMLFREIQIYGLVERTVHGFSIEPIKSYGMWTVTATNGEDTTTQDVLVDAAVGFEIEMSYDLWLYRDGEVNESVGLTVRAHPTYGSGQNINNGEYYRFGATSAGSMSGAVLFSNLLDLAPYTTLRLKAKHTSHATTDSKPSFGISSTSADQFSNDGTHTFVVRQYLPVTSSTVVTEYTADISGVDSGYVCVQAWATICEIYELQLVR